MSETTRELPEIRLAIGSLPNVRVFRNNVGAFRVRCRTGERIVKTGLHVGSADLIGWTSYEVQPEDVGKKISVFTSVEVKTPTGEPSDEQLVWRDVVHKAGGIALITHSKTEAVHAIQSWHP